MIFFFISGSELAVQMITVEMLARTLKHELRNRWRTIMSTTSTTTSFESKQKQIESQTRNFFEQLFQASVIEDKRANDFWKEDVFRWFSIRYYNNSKSAAIFPITNFENGIALFKAIDLSLLFRRLLNLTGIRFTRIDTSKRTQFTDEKGMNIQLSPMISFLKFLAPNSRMVQTQRVRQPGFAKEEQQQKQRMTDGFNELYSIWGIDDKSALRFLDRALDLIGK